MTGSTYCRVEADGISRRQAVNSFEPLPETVSRLGGGRRFFLTTHLRPASNPMNSIRAKLSLMMFLELAIYGSWLPLLGLYIGNDYLKFTDDQQGWVFNAFAIASITGMFFGGQLADRYFAQERFLAFSHLIGGLAMLGLAYQTTYWPFFGLMLLHCFFFVPTMSVTNAIAFANIKDARDFGFIRLWGTVGWIAASWPLIFIPIDWAKVPSMADSGRFRELAGEGARHTENGSRHGSGPLGHVHRRRSRLPGAGGILLAVAAYAAVKERRFVIRADRGVQAAGRWQHSWCCSS